MNAEETYFRTLLSFSILRYGRTIFFFFLFFFLLFSSFLFFYPPCSLSFSVRAKNTNCLGEDRREGERERKKIFPRDRYLASYFSKQADSETSNESRTPEPKLLFRRLRIWRNVLRLSFFSIWSSDFSPFHLVFSFFLFGVFFFISSMHFTMKRIDFQGSRSIVITASTVPQEPALCTPELTRLTRR